LLEAKRLEPGSNCQVIIEKSSDVGKSGNGWEGSVSKPRFFVRKNGLLSLLLLFPRTTRNNDHIISH